VNKYEWQRAFIETVHGNGGEMVEGTQPITVPRYSPLLPPEPAPSVPEDEFHGPGWGQSYTVPVDWVFPVDDD
jgi:hypothetical protein